MNIKQMYNSFRIKLREKTNPYLAAGRLKKAGINPEFSIISNNCWAGHVYRYFGVNYLTPTVGMYLFAPDYVKFVKELKKYIEMDIQFISYEQSKYKDEIVKRHQEHVPVGVLGDVEIMFLHYKTEEEARQKWTRRKARINWDNLFFKMTEMNLCTPELLREFDELPYEKKVIFVTRDYGLKSQILFKECEGIKEVNNDTTNFRKYIDLAAWLRR